MTLNETVFYWFYQLAHKNELIDRIIYFVAERFDKIVLIIGVLFFIILFILHKDWKHKGWVIWVQEVFIIGVSVIGAWFTSFIIKSITQIPRPFIAQGDVLPLFIHGGYDSFPSGHATVFFGLATAVYLYHRRAGYFFFLSAILIAISRVIGGVHYPVDIIVGAVIGCLLSKGIHMMLSKCFKK